MIYKFDLECQSNQKVVADQLKKYSKDNLIEKEKTDIP